MQRHPELTVHSSHGTLTVCGKTGKVLRMDFDEESDDVFSRTERVDLAEFYDTYPKNTDTDIDILDLGSWDTEGNYTPPEETWRSHMQGTRTVSNVVSINLGRVDLRQLIAQKRTLVELSEKMHTFSPYRALRLEGIIGLLDYLQDEIGRQDPTLTNRELYGIDENDA